MGHLDKHVAIVTGAGRGIGREHALLLAAEGARVVVNDLGGAHDGTGAAAGPAEDVAAEIRAAGGEAVANGDDVSDAAGASRIVQTALDSFGRVDVLVNNAGILRDRMLTNLTEDDWDLVVRVHLKGHAAPTHWAAKHWRQRTKAGQGVKAAVLNTTSAAGLIGNPGQTNYSAAKGGVALFTMTAAQELDRYGVRVNALAPVARTRLLMTADKLAASAGSAGDAAAFDGWDPQNVAPIAQWLVSDRCRFTGKVVFAHGTKVGVWEPWKLGRVARTTAQWTPEQLDDFFAGAVVAAADS